MQNIQNITTLVLLSIVILLIPVILAINVFADNDSVVDEVSITVPMSCTMSGNGMTSHNANIANGTYQADIGSTTLKAFCNDSEGFAIYAIGYTDDEYGNTNLVGTNTGNTIATGTAISAGNPDVSNWAMKLTTTSSPTPTYPITIAGSSSDSEKEQGDPDFSTYTTIPTNYAKVAYRSSGTDTGTNAEGSTLTTTYAAYISKTQAADTYTGQVKYTLVHPSDHAAPIAKPATLDTGQTVNTKLKSLAATAVNGEETTITSVYTSDNYIKSINVHLKTSAPAGFIPTEANTVSASTSQKPIYLVFDNTNNAGIMHFYTEGDQIFLSPDSSYIFSCLDQLANFSDISNWNTSNVTNMGSMFSSAGYSAATFTLDLSSWDTSNVTNMSYMFSHGAGYSAATFTLDLSSWDTSSVQNMSWMFGDCAGYSATTWSINGLSSWDTSSVTNMNYVFYLAGYSATTFTLDLSSWDTSNVVNMESMFLTAGYSATVWSVGDLSSWNTSSVVNMTSMFSSAGHSATAWSVGDLSSWDTSNVVYMGAMFSSAGYSATTFTLDLSSWNTSNVTNMGSMFSSAGYSATTFTLDLSSWNTSNVTNIYGMFGYGEPVSATTWSVTIPQTNGNNISNTTSRFYGKITSEYAWPPSGKSFTLAQP